MGDDNDKKGRTDYDGWPSDRYKNKAKIICEPRTTRNKHKWQEELICGIDKLIDGKELDAIEGKFCHIYVAFYIHGSGTMPDVDNLQKGFFDALKNPDGNAALKYPEKKRLLNDDGFVRAIKAQREIIPRDKEEYVRFMYLVTKTFKIIDVEKIEEEDLKEFFRGHWNDPMQLITAREIKDGKEGTKEYKFIDNAIGACHVTEKTQGKYQEVIPGYNWDNVKEQEVEGCLVFKITHQSEKGKDWEFWWLKKWSDPF